MDYSLSRATVGLAWKRIPALSGLIAPVMNQA